VYRNALRSVAALGALCSIALASPASAIPGQSIATFKSWAAHERVLSGIKPVKDELSGWPAFQLLSGDHGITWRFYALSDGSTMRRESLSVSAVGKEPGTASIRHDGNGYGFVFFSALYGSDVANDFRHAALSATFKGANGATTRYYLGRRFGYVEAAGLVLETPAAFKIELAQAQRCAKKPNECSE
jgi:hypothetical protein